MGLTGAAHPVSALGRCVWATGVLVIYRWLVEQTVDATNTITHAILGFPVVANGLASIITVLFGGALLLGAGGVFGAFLVIVGVVFAAALFASSEALTVLLALVFCAGPPFIALAPIPELSHLARGVGPCAHGDRARADRLDDPVRHRRRADAGCNQRHPRRRRATWTYCRRVRRADHVHPCGEATDDAVRGAAADPRRRAAR